MTKKNVGGAPAGISSEMMYKNDVMVKYEVKGEWITGEETESISIMMFIILKLNVNKIMSNKFPKIYDAKYYFDDDLYQLEVESKGCLLDIIVEFSNNIKYKISFYDISRFSQDVAEELQQSSFLYEENIIFLTRITKNNIIRTINELENKGIYCRLKDNEI